MPLPDKEYQRQLRQIETQGWGLEAQQGLKEARVLVIGLGAIGLAASQLLSASGVGFLALCDQAVLQERDLSSQSLLQMQDLGKAKAKAACSRLWSAHPFTRHFPLCYQVQPGNLPKLLETVSLVVDTSCNDATHSLVADACLMAGKPWVMAEARGSSFSVAWFPAAEDPGARYQFEDVREAIQAPLTGTGLWTAAAVQAGLEAATLVLRYAGTGPLAGAWLVHRNLWTGSLESGPLQGPYRSPDDLKGLQLLSAEAYGLNLVDPLED